MARVRRDANAWLLLRLSRSTGALLQIGVVKSTFGRPRYGCDVRYIWSISAKERMRPNLDEAPLSGHDPCLLSHPLHLPDEMAQLGGEQEPGAFHREGR